MKNHIHSILLTTALGVVGASAEVDCVALSQSVSLGVANDKSLVLEIVSKETAAAPGCACEIVKSAIKATKAENATVAAIVEAAITAAPDQMRLISQCAIAIAPDAISEIQAVLAKLDPNSGESVISSKSSKAPADEVASEDWNPLDIPGDKREGPQPKLRPGPPTSVPPSLNPPSVTDPLPDVEDEQES